VPRGCAIGEPGSDDADRCAGRWIRSVRRRDDGGADSVAMLSWRPGDDASWRPCHLSVVGDVVLISRWHEALGGDDVTPMGKRARDERASLHPARAVGGRPSARPLTGAPGAIVRDWVTKPSGLEFRDLGTPMWRHRAAARVARRAGGRPGGSTPLGGASAGHGAGRGGAGRGGAGGVDQGGRSDLKTGRPVFLSTTTGELDRTVLWRSRFSRQPARCSRQINTALPYGIWWLRREVVD
jgi:hypothetical protein